MHENSKFGQSFERPLMVVKKKSKTSMHKFKAPNADLNPLIHTYASLSNLKHDLETLKTARTNSKSSKEICKLKSTFQHDLKSFLDPNTFLTLPGIYCNHKHALTLKESLTTVPRFVHFFQNQNA